MFDGEAALAAIQERSRRSPGDVVVHPRRGPGGRPRHARDAVADGALVGQGLGDSIGLVTDGRFSGGTTAGGGPRQRRRRGSADRSRWSRNGDTHHHRRRRNELFLHPRGPTTGSAARRTRWRPPAPATPAASSPSTPRTRRAGEPGRGARRRRVTLPSGRPDEHRPRCGQSSPVDASAFAALACASGGPCRGRPGFPCGDRPCAFPSGPSRGAC